MSRRVSARAAEREERGPFQFRTAAVHVPLSALLTAWLLRKLGHAVWWLLRRPMVLGPLVGIWLLVRLVDAHGTALAVGTILMLALSVVVLVVWRVRSPDSFTRTVGWRVRGGWRSVFVYRAGWSTAMSTTGLAVSLAGRNYLPKRIAVSSTGTVDRVRVRMLPGQVLDDWATVVAIRCGSTQEAVCPPCAKRAQRLRMQQCAEGWHLLDDPLPPEPDLIPEPDDVAGSGVDDGSSVDGSRQVRSTRRRPDAVDLPRVPQEHRTVGRAFTAPDGTTYRPSMFVTLTLGSYGRVIPGTGTPVNLVTYDYRRAAVEAMFFPRLFDRWIQNLRRCAGFKVQYFGAVEPQRRLAPHIHVAIRGAIPRATLRAVTRATYLQLWWPSFEDPVYPESDPDRAPSWDYRREAFCDPGSGAPLPTWEHFVAQLDDDDQGEGVAGPAVVMRFGTQVDIAGIIAPSPDADRAIRYLVKYLTKSVAAAHTDSSAAPAYESHIDRLWQEVRMIPCSAECGVWLRYGIQPKNATEDTGLPTRDGCWCPAKAHTREHLGLGGRRVQVSRAWSGKTLSEHRADRATVVRAVLEEAGVEAPEAERMSAATLAADGSPRFVWDDVPVEDRDDYLTVVLATVREAHRWRQQYDEAKTRAAARASPAA